MQRLGLATPVPAERLPAMERLVPRRALFDALSGARGGQVVLLCAPAGSGKTVLLRSWMRSPAVSDPVAWVSVERDEEDAQHFWLSLIDALAGAVHEEGLVERISATPAFHGDGIIEPLLSSLDGLEAPVVLMIDDLHELRSPDALRLLERFLARIPATLRVVLSTRADPELGLHRQRLTGDLVEIRGADLRFSFEETRGLLEADAIPLEDATVAQLHERTEGWAAGLRLAAISLAAHPDRERFVSEFSGSERTVAAYLLAEVLERQPAEVRDLLLRTSIMDRVSGPLADFVTGVTGSERILQGLEDANAFVSSIDAGRTWFRYHHLFADLLRLELRRLSPASIRPLHRAAAEWHEEHGDMVEAIRHAQTAGDWPDATRMVADNYVSVVFDGRLATLHGLLAAFPKHAADTDPELALAVAKVRLYDGHLEDCARHLSMAEQLLQTVPGDRRERFALQHAETTLALARRRGDLPTVVESMRSIETALSEQRGERPRARQRPAGRRAHEPRHRRTLGVADGGGSRAPRAGARARAEHRAAVPGARVPRAPRHRRSAHRAACLRRPRGLRAGDVARQRARLDGGPGHRGWAGRGWLDPRVAGAVQRGGEPPRAGPPHHPPRR